MALKVWFKIFDYEDGNGTKEYYFYDGIFKNEKELKQFIFENLEAGNEVEILFWCEEEYPEEN